MTLLAPTLLPVTYPAFTFRLHIPGKPIAKGSLDTRWINGHSVAYNPAEVQTWMRKAKTLAISEHNRMIKADPHNDQFPYRWPCEAWALFIFDRPSSYPSGPPIGKGGEDKDGDTDKMPRGIGDALQVGNKKYPGAGIIADDKLIQLWHDPWKIYEDQLDQTDPMFPHYQGPGVYLKITEFVPRPVKLSDYL